MRAWIQVVKMHAYHLTVLFMISASVSACGRTSRVPGDVVEIIRAIDANDIPKLTALLDRGATPTPKDSPLSVLHAAITQFRDGKLICDDTALQLLLDHGADPNFVDQDSGASALEDALAMGDVRCAALLKQAGANVRAHGHSTQSALQFAVKGAVRTADTRILKLVLSWDIDPNISSGGRVSTALHEAAWANPAQADAAGAVITELLRSGADPCIADSEGNTALDIARNLKRSASIQRLLADAMRECAGRRG